MDTMSDLMKYMLKSSRSKLYEGKYTPALLFQEHMGVYGAIKGKDSRKARELMLQHLNGVEEEIIKGFSDDKNKD
jgi:GntR family transcriptional repressor for pyruvate dehydrogenase complex